ncbi:MAG: hypothetical protein JO273_23765 [Methylobacteriaceae bacterium]|nr:hypothetical protein [Methylobacteriaceae bacterium]
MSVLLSSLFLLALLCASAAVGFFVRSRLREEHISKDGIELLQLVIGLLVTFAALVLGLLTASVKSAYDNASHDRGQYAARLAQLDRCMRNYGAGSEPTRAQLASYTAAVIASTWPSEARPQGVTVPDVSTMARTGENPVLAGLMNEIGLEIHQWKPADALHEKLAADCAQQFGDVMKARWAVIEEAHGSISAPFYWILVFWLMVVFASFGLRTPRNALVLIVIGLCAVSVSSAIFVILDMDQPYGGLFGVSSESMRNALKDMLR